MGDVQAEVSTSDADEAVLASDYQATQPNETDNRCCRRKDLQFVKVMGCNSGNNSDTKQRRCTNFQWLC